MTEPAVTKRARLVKSDPTHIALDDPRLDVYRPDPELVKQYVSRTMPNGQKDVEYMMQCWTDRENVILVGDTQGGKTMLVNVMACLIGEAMGLGKPLPVFTLSGSSGVTDFDLFGQPTVFTDEDGVERVVWLPGIPDMAARIGGIFYLDEIPMMPERVTSTLHPMTDWRRSFVNRKKAMKVPGDGYMPEVVKLSDNTWIVGTMNAGYRGSGALNEAFANRFRHLDWDYDETVEATLVPNEGVRLLGQALRQARALGSIQTPVGTAALMRLCRDVERDGVDMALFSLTSMFTPEERVYVVNEIILARSFKNLLMSMPDTVQAGWSDTDSSPFG